jgi:hypothetical protein
MERAGLQSATTRPRNRAAPATARVFGRCEPGDVLDLRAGIGFLQRAGIANNIVNLLTTKGILMDGGVGSKNAGDRAGIHCRTVTRCGKVLDAIKGYETGDEFHAIPKSLIPKSPTPVSSSPIKSPNKPLKECACHRPEFMVKHTKNDVAISDQIDKEIKTVLEINWCGNWSRPSTRCTPTIPACRI